MQVNQDPNQAPPRLEFEFRPVEDRAKTLATGGYATKDVAFVLVHRPGSKDVHEEDAVAWGKKLAERARQGLCPSTWVDDFNRVFAAWQKGEEIPVSGTPIKLWPALSPSAAKLIVGAGFLTVEQLASANDVEIGAIGLGAIDFRNRARQYLEAASGPGKMAEEMRALKAQNEAMQAQIADLVAANQAAKIAAAVQK
jgi:hypothetical protein